MPRSQAPAHWSKDFVEHPRTVHFTLIAISVALILLASSTNPYNSLIAIRELEAIIELQTLWSSGSFESLAPRRGNGGDVAEGESVKSESHSLRRSFHSYFL